MATTFPQLGMGGILSFQSSGAISNMRAAARAFDSLRSSNQRFQKGINNVGQAIPMLGIALSGLAIPFYEVANSAYAYEEALSGVRAVTLSTRSELEQLDRKAIDLSLSTSFLATETASAMEIMARAGFSVNETMSGVGGILYAAAAEGLPLAETADIVTIALRGMGLEAQQTGRVADVLAYTSANTNSSIRDLGEAFIYGSTQARMAGMNLEETASAFGLLANYGVRGSMAGTNFSESLRHMIEPTKKGRAWLQKMGLSLKDVSILAHGAVGVFSNLEKGYLKLDKFQRARMLPELFGVRGARGAGPILSILEKDQDALRRLIDLNSGAAGTAQKMAAIRLENVRGRLKMLRAAFEAFVNTAMKPFLGPMRQGLERFIDAIASVARAGRVLASNAKDPIAALAVEYRQANEAARGFLRTETYFLDPTAALLFAQGIRDGLDSIRAMVEGAAQAIRKAGDHIRRTFGDDTLRRVAKFATEALVIGSVLGPLLFILGGVGFGLKGIMIGLTGFFQIGTSIAPMVSKLLTLFAGLGGGVIELLNPFLILDGAIGAIAPLAASLSGSIGALALKFGMTQASIGAFSAVIGKIAAIPIFSGLLNPFVGGLVLLSGAFGAASRDGETFSQTLIRLTSEAGPAFTNWIKTVPQYVEALWIRLQSASAAAGKVFAPIFAVLDKAVGGILRAMSPIWTGVVYLFKSLVASVGGILQSIWSLIKTAMPGIATSIGPLSTILTVLVKIGAEFLGSLFRILGVAVRITAVVIELFLSGFGAIIKGSAQFVKRSQELIGGGFSEAWNTIRNGFQAAIDWMRSVAYRFFSSLKTRAVGWFASVGGFFRGIGAAISNFLSPVINAIKPWIDSIKSIASVVKDELGEAWNSVLTIVKTFATAIENYVMMPVRAAAGLLADLLSGVSGLAKTLGINNLAATIEGLRSFSENRLRIVQPGEPGFIGPVMPSAEEIARLNAQNRAAGVRKPSVNVTINQPPAQVYVTTKTQIDGRELAGSMARYETEIRDRAGVGLNPWQRQTLQVRAVPGY